MPAETIGTLILELRANSARAVAPPVMTPMDE